MNHYERLGVPTGADPATIRRAYLALARRHHPDLHADSDAATQAESRLMMQEVNRAWTVLGHPDQRRRYDEQLRQGTADAPRARPASGAPPGPGWRPRADDTAWMDDFEAWKQESDVLAPDVPDSGPRRPLMVVPVGLFVLGIATGSVGLVLKARGLMAAAYILVLLSALLFVAMPMLAMTRRGGRRS